VEILAFSGHPIPTSIQIHQPRPRGCVMRQVVEWWGSPEAQLHEGISAICHSPWIGINKKKKKKKKK
jgi:hypothetical protein